LQTGLEKWKEVRRVACKREDLSEINMLVADTSHFNQEIVDGLKKGMGRS